MILGRFDECRAKYCKNHLMTVTKTRFHKLQTFANNLASL